VITIIIIIIVIYYHRHRQQQQAAADLRAGGGMVAAAQCRTAAITEHACARRHSLARASPCPHDTPHRSVRLYNIENIGV